MATKRPFLSSTEKHVGDNIASNFDIRYNNLNLNQIHKSIDDKALLSKTCSNFNKINNVSQDCNVYLPKENLCCKSWNNSDFSKSFQSLNIYDSVGVNEKKWKDKSETSANNSTLSLHIAAYENSIISISDSDEQNDCKKKKLQKNNGFKRWKDVKQFFNSKEIQSSFEFPRQQENRAKKPEVMQFKASQRLMNLNEKKKVMEKKDVSEKDAKRLKEAVVQLSKLVSNSICADCHQQRSLWASVNFGVFLCSRCAGMHRHLGVHITQVRSINLDTWTPIQLLCVTINGNMWTNSWLLSNKSPDYGRHILDDPSMSRFIQDKYEHTKFGDNSGILRVTKSNFPYITVEKALEVYKLAMTLHRQQVDHCNIRPQLIAAAGFDFAVPTNNPGSRKLLLVMEDSRGGDQKQITQAHISGIPQGKKASSPVTSSFKTSSNHQQLGHTASASNIRVSNFIDIDDFGDNTVGMARVNLSGDSTGKSVHAPAKSSSFGVFPTEAHSEPAWPTINASSGGNLNSFFKEPPPSTVSSSDQGFFGTFKTSTDQNIRNDTTDQSKNTFIPNFDLTSNEKSLDNGEQKANNNSHGSFFIENILAPSSSTPNFGNELGDFVMPSLTTTPFSHNTVQTANGNAAKKEGGGDATQDKDFILSLYSK